MLLLSMCVRMSGIAHSVHALFVFNIKKKYKLVSMLSTTTFKTRIKTMDEKTERGKKSNRKNLHNNTQYEQEYKCPEASYALFILARYQFSTNGFFVRILFSHRLPANDLI